MGRTRMAQIGAQGRRVMEAIGQGRTFRRSGDGWRAGTLAAPDSVVQELGRHDLVRVHGEALALTAAGLGWTQRAARPDLPNRLLAERAVAVDGGDDSIRPGTGPGRPLTPPLKSRGGPARTVTVNLAESPLGWLLARGLVSARQYKAGERLRGDWTVAGMGPRVTMRWDAAPQSGTARGPGAAIDPTLAQIAAKRRFEAAIAAAGPGLRDVLWRVACAGEGLETTEKALGWPRRAGKLVLLMALDRIADHYGLR